MQEVVFNAGISVVQVVVRSRGAGYCTGSGRFLLSTALVPTTAQGREVNSRCTCTYQTASKWLLR